MLTERLPNPNPGNLGPYNLGVIICLMLIWGTQDFRNRGLTKEQLEKYDCMS